MTRRERLERKLEKRIDWARSRKSAADAEFSRADLTEEKSGIPFGQPILVGHHSERRHRRAIERADNAMRRFAENAAIAAYHKNKAAGIERQLAKTIFSDDADAVEALDAKIAKMEAERELNNKINSIVRKNPRAIETPEKVASLVDLGMSCEAIRKVFEADFCGRFGIPAYVNQNLNGRIADARKRKESIKVQQEHQQQAKASTGGVLITGSASYVSITFAEKPECEIINALKAVGFYWRRGSWNGTRANIPACVLEMTT